MFVKCIVQLSIFVHCVYFHLMGGAIERLLSVAQIVVQVIGVLLEPLILVVYLVRVLVAPQLIDLSTICHMLVGAKIAFAI